MPSQYRQPSPDRRMPAIRWQGRAYNIADAVALAIREHQQGKFQTTADIYALILAQVPQYAEGHNNRGVALQQLNRHDEALACYEKAVALKPDYANAHYNRGSLLKKMNRPEEALASYERAIAFKPSHAEAHNNRGVLLQELKRYDEALASYDQAIAIQPHYADAYFNRATVLVNKGDMSGAETMFLKAIELKPHFSAAWFNLANIRQYGSTDNTELKAIQQLLSHPTLSPEDKEYLYFTLGKICDDCGQYDQAFEYFRIGNETRRARVSYDPAAVEKLTGEIIEVFTPDLLKQTFAFGSTNQPALFIVGMPRSGTTLLANMLSNHPAIATAGELPTLTHLTGRWLELSHGKEPYPQAAKHISGETAARVIAEYEKRLLRDAAPEAKYIIDKNPLNFRNVGLIQRLFPKARILHCTRDALDTCLSNYFQRFPPHLNYAFDLGDIGHFYGQYNRLMEHWRTVPGVPWLEIDYADMVLKTEETARRALAFLGLEWDDRCAKPHTNPNAVETASQWQVRQPIYEHSLGRWRHYEKYLAPLKQALSAAGSQGSKQPADESTAD